MTIVNDANHALSAGFDLDANRLCAGIQRILKQFFHDRSGPLHNFASCDLVGDSFRQYAYAAHRALCYSLLCSLRAIPSWSSWTLSTSDGDSAIRSCAAVVFPKAITSRIDFSPASSITTRSMPSAIPPCGGVP